jgi:hypothetical protein
MTRCRARFASDPTALVGFIASAAAILAPQAAAAQDLSIPDVTYPSLPRQAGTAEGFVPSGWVLDVQVSGDLNRDGDADLVLVLRQNSPANIIEGFEGVGEKPFDTNPRILAIAFRERLTGNYSLQLENHTLIPRRTEPAAEDPFDRETGIAILRGGFQVRLNWFMTAGGWETFNTTHTFRHKSGRFELIGYDHNAIHRGSGDTTSLSVNYLTRKVKKSAGHISRDTSKARWQTLPPGPSPTLESIGDGLSFEPKL